MQWNSSIRGSHLHIKYWHRFYLWTKRRNWIMLLGKLKTIVLKKGILRISKTVNERLIIRLFEWTWKNDQVFLNKHDGVNDERIWKFEFVHLWSAHSIVRNFRKGSELFFLNSALANYRNSAREGRNRISKLWTKKLSLWHKLWFSNPYICAF